MWKKIIITLLILITVGGGLFYYKTSQTAGVSEANVRPVKVIEVKPSAMTTTVMADGHIRLREEFAIKPQLNGFVEEIYIDSGDYVNKDDILFAMDDEALKNELKLARLNLEEARSNYNKILHSFKQQDQLNKLKIEEAERNLEIAMLSAEKEENNLKVRKQSTEDKLKQAGDELEKARKELTDNKKLYQNNAIPRKTLEEAEDVYKKAEETYNNYQEELDNLTETIMPNTLELSQLEIENARNKLAIVRASIEQNNISQNDLKLAEIKMIKAENKVQELKEQLNKIICTAPQAGTIIDLQINRGVKLIPGQTVARIANIDNIIIEALIDEIHINQVEVGQQVIITSDALPIEFRGTVFEIAPVATEVGNINKFKTKIKIASNQGLLKPGMFVNNEIITNSRENVIGVPPLAVLGEEEKYVFIVQDGKATKRKVQTGLKNLSQVEVTGIKSGEKVIVGPYTVLQQLKPGMNVREL